MHIAAENLQKKHTKVNFIFITRRQECLLLLQKEMLTTGSTHWVILVFLRYVILVFLRYYTVYSVEV